MSEMTKEEKKEEMIKLAGNYYNVGLNCSECVLKSWLDLEETSYPPEIIALASPFGAGIGKTRNTCGALIGACLAAATVKGRKDPLEKETMKERVEELNGKDGVYEFFGNMVREFEGKYGSVVCSELIDPFEDKESIERKRFCKGIIKYGAELAGNNIIR